MARMARIFLNTRRLVTGVLLTLTVSLATAAIVICLPDSPVNVANGRDVQVAANMNAYVQLHRARNAVVPLNMRINVEPDAR